MNKLKTVVSVLVILLMSLHLQAQTVTFTVKKRLVCYVAYVVKTQSLDASIISAIAKACTGVNSMDGNVTVTITEEDVVNIFSKLTNMPEGVAAKHNNVLQDVLTPLLADRPALAEQITNVLSANASLTTSFENDGLSAITKTQQAISNND